MKRTKILVLALLTIPLLVLAADSVTDTPVAAPAGNANSLLLAIIPVLVPLLVALGKWALPKVPTWILPILAPALGALVDFIATWTVGATSNPVLGAVLGSAGVGVRELFDQVKGRMSEPVKTLPLILLCVALPCVAITPGCGIFKTKPTAEAVVYYTFKDSWTFSKTAYDSWSERVVLGKVTQEQSDKVDAAWNKFRAAFKASMALARNDWAATTPASLLSIQKDLLALISTFSK